MYSMRMGIGTTHRGREIGQGAAAHARPRPALEPFYYLKNFEGVLSTLLDRYPDLLSEQELLFIEAFPRAPQNSRALFVRMVMRCGDLFKASSLDYPEIGNTLAAAAPLIEAGWINPQPLLRLEELQGLLSKTELIRHMKLPPRYVHWRKPALAAMLAAQFPQPRVFADWCATSADTVYRLQVAPLCERFRLMFFGNERQLWSEFVTADLMIFTYQKIEPSLHSRPFQTRAQIKIFEQLQECCELLDAGIPLDALTALLPPAIADSEWLEDRRQRLLFRIAREFERTGAFDAALPLYSECTHRGARTRAIRLNARARDWPATRSLCLAALENPESEEERQQVQRVLERASRKLGIARPAKKTPPPIPEFDLLLDTKPGAVAVECLVRDHLARDLSRPAAVRYVENGLITSLFGLLCWPAIFAAIPGAFFHDYHYGPADLGSGQFWHRRRREFEECFSELQTEHYRQSMWRTFERKWGIQSPFVRWQTLDKTLLRWTLECCPASHLRLWFEWMVRDLKDNRAGFPDLIQFWPGERRYRMIEVKGPGDRLQDNQRRFLEYCVTHGMPVAVCHARWSGDPARETTNQTPTPI